MRNERHPNHLYYWYWLIFISFVYLFQQTSSFLSKSTPSLFFHLHNPTSIPFMKGKAKAKAKNAKLTTTTTTLVQSQMSDATSHDSLFSFKPAMNRLNSYLLHSNMSHYHFQRNDGYLIQKKEDHDNPVSNSNEEVLLVKSLLWEVVTKSSISMSMSMSNQKSNPSDDNVHELSNSNRYYVMTASLANSFIDEKKLLSEFLRVLSNNNNTGISVASNDWTIALTDRELTEYLTGYEIGCIPPIGLGLQQPLQPPQTSQLNSDPSSSTSKNLASSNNFSILFLDETLYQLSYKDNKMISVGSGSLNHDLHIPIQDVIQLSDQQYRYGVQISSIITTSPKSRMEENPSTEEKYNLNAINTSQILGTTPVMKHPKSLSKQLRDASGKQGKAEEVRYLIECAGDDFPSTVEIGTTGNFTKNALHLAAWKGDLQSILYLVNTGNKPSFQLDLVNAISIGEGNYGKTPIFYAITQDRDDAVSLLLDLNANLLIVNNKGQTPCSMAVTHLTSKTCERMFQIERKQLEDGGSFINYRESHSDGQRYGDLDPRFIIDKDNWIDDIEKEMEAIYDIVYKNDHSLSKDKMMMPLDINVYHRTYSKPIPRSLQPTTLESRRKKFERERIPKISLKTKEKLRNPKKKRNKQTVIPPKELVVDIDSLDQLRLTDIIMTPKCDYNNITSCFTLVDNLEGLEYLSKVVNDSIQLLQTIDDEKYPINGKMHPYSDETFVQKAWGLDCEWKPVYQTGIDNPVSTLQLSTFHDAFLVDVQSLCQPGIKSADTPMTETEAMLSNALIAIFANEKIPIVGFGIGQDLTKLSVSFPHIPCFQLFESVLDLHILARQVFIQTPKHYMSSLQKTVGILLKKRLDKTQQCSVWDARPLSMAQVEYAVLDAVVLPRLLLNMMTHPLTKERFDDGFFQKQPHLRSTIRMTILDSYAENPNDETAAAAATTTTTKTVYRAPMGSIKEVLSIRVARQTWTTGRQAPAMPECIPLEVLKEMHINNSNNNSSSSNIGQKLSKKEKRAAKKQLRIRRKSIKLNTIPGNLNDIPRPGTFLGYTKDSCIHRILGHVFMKSLPDDIRLGYNRRGGVFQIRNGWLLFINLGGGVQLGKYRNDFSKEGRSITFTVNPNNPAELALIDHFSQAQAQAQAQGQAQAANLKNSTNAVNQEMDENHPTVFLFIRSGTNAKFLFCGICGCAGQSSHDQGGIILKLELQNYDTLASDTASEHSSSSYMDIVQSHSASLRRLDVQNGVVTHF